MKLHYIGKKYISSQKDLTFGTKELIQRKRFVKVYNL